jgi:hypothetical protein
MNQEERIKLQIEKLKDEKENLKFGHSSYTVAYLSIIIFLATITISITNSIDGLMNKGIILIFLMIIIFICHCGFNYAIKWRTDKLDEKAKEIEILYNRLLK